MIHYVHCIYVCVSIISLININKLQLLISNEFYDKKFCLTNEKLLPPPLCKNRIVTSLAGCYNYQGTVQLAVQHEVKYAARVTYLKIIIVKISRVE